MNLAWKSLHGVLMQNEKENTQHLDKECVQRAEAGSWAVRQSEPVPGPIISATRNALGLEPGLDITEHIEK